MMREALFTAGNPKNASGHKGARGEDRCNVEPLLRVFFVLFFCGVTSYICANVADDCSSVNPINFACAPLPFLS